MAPSWPLRRAPTALVASVPIQKDGMYHVAALEGGEDVRLSEDYFIEAQKDQPPEVKITRPGPRFQATPIEEVDRRGGSQGRFRPEGRGSALLRERRARKGRSAAAKQGRQDRHRQQRPSPWKITRCSRATW